MISRKGVKGPSLLIYQTYSSYLYLYPTEKPDWRRRSGSHCQCSGNESNFDSLAPWCPFFFWRSILVLTNHAYFDFIQNNQIGEVGASKIGEALFSYHQNLISLNLEVSGSDFRCTTLNGFLMQISYYSEEKSYWANRCRTYWRSTENQSNFEGVEYVG